MKEQAICLQGYKPKEVIVTGVPQFDFYVRKDGLIPRAQFCKKFNFNPNKKIILFSSTGGDLCDEAYYIELIKKFLPIVRTIELGNDPTTYASTIQQEYSFNVLNITDEDRKRGDMYFQQKKRSELKTSSTNLDEFLKELNITVHIKNANDFTIPRISQLTLKTNQFNLTTRRYQENDIRQFVNDEKNFVGCAEIKDKFGNNGITSVFIVKEINNEWRIDTFLLSCRVMGRRVEDVILRHILKEAKKKGIKKVYGEFIPTKKNIPSQSFFEDNDFKKEEKYWVHNLENIKDHNFITLIIDKDDKTTL